MLGLAMRIIFMGSPDFAVPSLSSVAEHFDIVGVFTQPDRPSGRGRKLKHSNVKARSVELGLPIFQPASLKGEEAEKTVRELEPSLVVVAAYGHILSQAILDIPTVGSINVHASLLPRWRGAAPVQAAILHGDAETGITLMLIDAGLDTGPILSQRSITIQSDDTARTLTKKLALLGAEMLPETITRFIASEIQPTPQDDEIATYAHMLKKRDGILNFKEPAASLERQVRAYEPWPTSYFLWDDLRIVVRKAHVSMQKASLTPGQTTAINDFPGVVTSDGTLVLDIVQPAGKRALGGADFLRGAPTFLDQGLQTKSE
jgi:methionyl-tRNA formyltransferase